jgi:hypothetical protein
MSFDDEVTEVTTGILPITVVDEVLASGTFSPWSLLLLLREPPVQRHCVMAAVAVIGLIAVVDLQL